MQTGPKFQEEYSAKIPALALLSTLGWTFLPPEQALSARANHTSEVILKNILKQELKKRRFLFNGKNNGLSEKAIDKIISIVASPALNEGLIAANEKIYNHLLYGISVTEFIEGKKATPTIPLINWQQIEQNSFTFTEEFTVSRSNGVDTRRPDIVCFVNGIPFVVIEAKRPDSKSKKGPTVEEGISQCLRNQRNDEIPRLFAYSQLLLSISSKEGRYATCGTPAKFWAAWRDEVIDEAKMLQLKNQPLTIEQKAAIFNHRPGKDLDWHESLVASGEMVVSEQDKLLISLLTPSRLLEMTRFFTLFDKKIGKIVARYQQVFAIKRLIERMSKPNDKGSREGGVIWHTTGSGKSFTMVFLSKALIMQNTLKQCRIVVITDRVDLENQLSSTFMSSGELAAKKDKAAAMATSGQRLAEQIGKGNERIIFSLIQKFNSATKLPICKNNSADIIVLIDEGHRSQGGENHIRMKQALPNAAFVAFTGTPLLKDDKTTNKFGPIIHAYTMQRAVEDHTVTPLLYEERKPELAVNERAIDRWFERVTEGLTSKQQSNLKKTFSKKGPIYKSKERIQLIALDIANHFVKNIDDGLKGQLACDSKLSAIKYKKYLDEAGLFESAVVMSPPDTREGNTTIDESTIPEVTQWWKNNVGSQNEQSYTKQVVDRFNKDDKLKILIVVDKLLTGFDEPKNTVLYIDKPLKSHNLIQAIARVNRLHTQKKFGLLIDYRGILAELDITIQKYQDLASRTQAGFDIDDLAGLYNQMNTEYKRLPQLYKQLWNIFSDVKNKNDPESFRYALSPKIVEKDGMFVDSNQKVRDDFYEALTDFSSCLKVAVQSATFYEDKSFTEEDRRHYKETLKQFSSLRQSVQQDAGEAVNYDEYNEQIKKLLDKHVVGVEVKEPDVVYSVNKMGQQPNSAQLKTEQTSTEQSDQSTQAESWSETKTRSETDAIKSRVTRMIEQNLRDDPYAQEAFSQLLRKAIEEAEQQFNHPLKQYLIFHELEEKAKSRELEDTPQALQGEIHAQKYFGVFKKVLPAAFSVFSDTEQQTWIALAFKIETLVEQAVTENSLNPQNIESSIRKQLLPILFKECKAIGSGMDQAKTIVDWVVQITRVGSHPS